jgi:hypothetical protein
MVRYFTAIVGVALLASINYDASAQNTEKLRSALPGEWQMASVKQQDADVQKSAGMAFLALAVAQSGFDHLVFTADGTAKLKDKKGAVLSSVQYTIPPNSRYLVATFERKGRAKTDTLGQLHQLSRSKLKLTHKDGYEVIMRSSN